MEKTYLPFFEELTRNFLRPADESRFNVKSTGSEHIMVRFQVHTLYRARSSRVWACAKRNVGLGAAVSGELPVLAGVDQQRWTGSLRFQVRAAGGVARTVSFFFHWSPQLQNPGQP